MFISYSVGMGYHEIERFVKVTSNFMQQLLKTGVTPDCFEDSGDAKIIEGLSVSRLIPVLVYSSSFTNGY